MTTSPTRDGVFVPADVEAVRGYASYVLPIVTALIGVWLVWTVVRYVRADRGTRVSMRQAVRVRWGWVRLARMAGLTVTDKTPSLLAQITAQKDSPPPAPRVLTPKIKVKPDQFGVIVRAGRCRRSGWRSTRSRRGSWPMPGGARGCPCCRTAPARW
ncbi:hypothetical protein [Streptomyces sp. 039-1]|uniref:hypothetical protein n=1 Tax=Streptomyces sp. 039-1 TaxID=2789263 RepID=UPI0039F53831